MSNRITEIRARLDAIRSPTPWLYRYNRGLTDANDRSIGRVGWYNNDGTFVAHAPADIAWLLAEVDARDSDREDIYDLRDQVNALWDIVHEQDIPDVLDRYGERLAAQRRTRIGIGADALCDRFVAPRTTDPSGGAA